MTVTSGKSQCFICGGKEKSTYNCRGCSKDFCFTHLIEHHQTFNKLFDEIEYDCDLFRQILIQQKEDSTKCLLIEQINKWENNSIYKIKQTAKQCKQLLIEHKNIYINQIENKLNKLSDQIKEIRKENEFNEIDLNQLKTKLTQLTEQLNKPSNISINQDSTSFINQISVVVSKQLNSFDNINLNTKWVQNGITVAGGNRKGDKLNQLYSPQGIYVDDDQTIYIADWWNHRIIAWKSGAKNGQVVVGENGKGNQNNQLKCPTDVIIDKEDDCLIICDSGNRRIVKWPRRNNTSGQIIIPDIDCWGLTMDKDGLLYVSDRKKHEVRRWKIGDNYGTIVAGGKGQGNFLNQLNVPSYIFVDEDYSVYVSDSNNHRVMKWMKNAEEGIVVSSGTHWGNSLTQLYDCSGIIVDRFGRIYVSDCSNHRVMRWCKGVPEGTIVVGGNKKGEQSNQFNSPKGLSFDRQGNLYVVDLWNHRIQKFEIDLN